MKRRLFIAINLPEDIKTTISDKLSKLPEIPGAKIVKKDNWHFTLIFLGYQPEETFTGIIKSMAETLKNQQAPEIETLDISYGPLVNSPRMLWLNGTENTSKNLGILKNLLEEELIKNGVNFKHEYRPFKAHLTLSRFFGGSKQKLPLLAPSENKLRFSFIPESLDLMESNLMKYGAEYSILQRINFK